MYKTSNYLVIFFVLISSLFMFISCGHAENTNTFSIKNAVRKSQEENKSIHVNIHLSKKIIIPAIIDTTRKGNGTLNLNGLLIRIFDQHDDGMVYENSYLNMSTKDLDNDGINEIIFTGVAKFTGEKESDPASYQPITKIYKLDCSSGLIKLIYTSSNTNIGVEIRNSQKTKIKCQ